MSNPAISRPVSSYVKDSNLLKNPLYRSLQLVTAHVSPYPLGFGPQQLTTLRTLHPCLRYPDLYDTTVCTFVPGTDIICFISSTTKKLFTREIYSRVPEYQVYSSSSINSTPYTVFSVNERHTHEGVENRFVICDL